MKIVNLYSVLYTALFYATIICFLTQTVTARDWCWTKSMANDPSYVFNAANGGINWGYCKPKDAKPKPIKYTVELVTSSLPNSGTESQVSVQIFGTRGMTQEKELGSNIEPGSTKSFEIDDSDIGDINKLLIKITGTKGYRCKEVRIKKKGDTNIIFQCLKTLKPCHPGGSQFYCQDELLPQGGSSYEITLKTSGEPESGTTSPILVGVIGEKGVSNYQMFSETGADINSQITNVIKIKDVGKISGYQIRLAERGKWKGAHMLIKNIKTGHLSQFDLKDVLIENPGKDFYKYDSSMNAISAEASLEMKSATTGTVAFSSGGFAKVFSMAADIFGENEGDNQQEDDDDGLTELIQEVSESSSSASSEGTLDTGVSSGINTNDPYGGLIEQNEKKAIIQLDCMQKLINTDPTSDTFGPNYPTPNINYLNVLAKCPSNCHTAQGQVFGLGIHPDISPICLSALADKAISEYGGIISISIFPGLEKYVILDKNAKTKLGKIKMTSYFGRTKKSYTVSKVDNVDLVEKDIRILDHKGTFTNEGRVEVRVNGKWGTICNKKNNLETAKRICKDLGYNDGKWASPDGAAEFCKTFKGNDYCSSINYKPIFSDITCTKENDNFSTCPKKNANASECPNTNDAIISCTSQSFESGDMTPKGTARLEKVSKTPEYVIGRLELFNLGQYSPVCNSGFTSDSALVACKQLGYDSGSMITPDPDKQITKTIDDSSPFSATEVKCSGSEKKLLECNIKLSDIKCTHDLDVVLRCEGARGDPTGKSQIPGSNLIEAPPALGKLTMIKLKADCKFKGNNIKLRGDPGSVFIVKCPAHCMSEKGNIWGLGLYTHDSNVCLAAIHAGVINDDKGGSFALTKIWGQKYYHGFSRNGINSNELNDKQNVSFTVSALNSQWRNMWTLFRENRVGTFIEKQTQVNLRSKSRFNVDAINQVSFVESQMQTYLQSRSELISSLTTGVPKPVFEWIETDPSHNFSDKEKGAILLEDHNMTGMAKYQIILKASLADFKNKKSYLFSYSGCGGFNIYLDESDTIILGDPCNETNQVNTGIPFAMYDKTLIWVFYENSKMKIAVFNEKLAKPIAKVFNKSLAIPVGKSIGIGRKAEANDSFFFGTIDFVQVYVDEIPFTMIPKILDDINNRNKAPIPDVNRETVDNRSCVSPCSDAIVPGEPGAPEPPQGADPYAGVDTSVAISVNAKRVEVSSLMSNFLSDYKSSTSSTMGIKSENIRPNQGFLSSTSVSASQLSLSASKSLSSAIMKSFSRTSKSSSSSSSMSRMSSSSRSKMSSSASSSSSSRGSSSTSGSMSMGASGSLSASASGSLAASASGSLSASASGSLSASASGSFSASASGSFSASSSSSSSSSSSFASSSSSSFRFSSSSSSLSETYGTYDRKEQNNIESIILDCNTNLKDKRFNGSIGRIFRVKCPTCALISRPVYGSFIYHPLSSICKAASHAGNLNPLKSGYVIVELVAGKKIYNGSIGSDGTVSGTFSSAEISFRTKQGRSPLMVGCADAPNKEPFVNAPQGQKFVVICPKNCGKEKLEIFGSEVYTDTSSICLSAIHYGVLNDLGGEIEILIDGPQTFFKATKSFGIISKQKDAYIRSFRFVGVKSSIFYKYKEDFSGRITDKWEILVIDDVEKREENTWAFEEKKLKLFDEEKLVKYIVHRGQIKSKVKNNYGALIYLKNAQWSNGRVKANFMFKDKRTFALLFKFVDTNNYYSLEFNPESEKTGLTLLSRVDGSVKQIDTKPLRLNTGVWYRVEILMRNDKIIINVQNDTIREKKTYFALNLEQISRGTIAFATNGNNEFYISGVEIDDYIPHAGKKINPKNKRSWIELLKKTDDKTKKRFCEETYKSKDHIRRCVEPQFFCRLKCDEHIPTVENILNFNCYRDCVKKIKMNHNEFKVQKTQWAPKMGEKIDFLPKNERVFRPATVVSIQEKKFKGKVKKIYVISYFDDAGNSLKASSNFPDKSIVKCSERLQMRKDCN